MTRRRAVAAAGGRRYDGSGFRCRRRCRTSGAIRKGVSGMIDLGNYVAGILIVVGFVGLLLWPAHRR